MGVFGAIFGRKAQGFSANDARVLSALLALRVSRSYEAQGYSADEAQTLANELIKKIWSVPVAILKIIMDYAKIITQNVIEAKKQNVTLDLTEFRRNTIEHIEKFRNQLLGLPQLMIFR